MALPRNVRRRKPSHSQANVCSSPNTCNCPIPPVGVCMQGTIQGAGSWEMNYCATDNGWNIGFNGMDWSYDQIGTYGMGYQNGQPCAVTLSPGSTTGAHCWQDVWLLPNASVDYDGSGWDGYMNNGVTWSNSCSHQSNILPANRRKGGRVRRFNQGGHTHQPNLMQTGYTTAGGTHHTHLMDFQNQGQGTHNHWVGGSQYETTSGQLINEGDGIFEASCCNPPCTGEYGTCLNMGSYGCFCAKRVRTVGQPGPVGQRRRAGGRAHVKCQTPSYWDPVRGECVYPAMPDNNRTYRAGGSLANKGWEGDSRATCPNGQSMIGGFCQGESLGKSSGTYGSLGNSGVNINQAVKNVLSQKNNDWIAMPRNIDSLINKGIPVAQKMMSDYPEIKQCACEIVNHSGSLREIAEFYNTHPVIKKIVRNHQYVGGYGGVGWSFPMKWQYIVILIIVFTLTGMVC